MQAADINDIWERILQVAKQTLPPAIYSSLSTSLIPMSIDNNSIHIGVMQSFIKSVIESQQTVSKLLTDAIKQVTGKELNMVLLDLFPQKDEVPTAPQVADTFTGNTVESTTTNTIENAPLPQPKSLQSKMFRIKRSFTHRCTQILCILSAKRCTS